ALTWVIPLGASATPRAGGWVAQGAFLQPTATLDLRAGAMAVNSLSPILIGRAFHCRFGDKGPRCVPLPKMTGAMALLAAFTLQDGDAQREVLWVGQFGQMQPLPGDDPNVSLGIREVTRCETTEDSETITCKPVAMK